MNCPQCTHPMSEHTGDFGECMHGFEKFTNKAKEGCLCKTGPTIKQRLADAEAKLKHIILWAELQGYLPEHCFTFPDGETVYAYSQD